MGWLRRLFAQLTPEPTRRTAGGGGVFFPRSLSGVPVSPDSAMSIAAVYAAVSVIAQAVKGLPWRTYETRADGSTMLAPTHRTNTLLMREANPYQDALTWREQMLVSALLWGNGFAEIVRDGAGRASALYFIHPERVQVWTEGGTVWYAISNTANGTVAIPARNVFHVKGLGFDGIVGIPVTHFARETMGAAIASNQFEASFYGNGAAPSGIIKHPHALTAQAKKQLRDDWSKLYGGSKNAGRVAVLEEGLDYETIGIPQQEAQFIESRNFSVTEIARFFNVPPHKLADLSQAKWANIESEQINFAQDTVAPWALRFEIEADRKLYGQPRFSSQMSLNGLMRGDSKARGEFYRALFQVGSISPDEIRDLEGMNPLGEDGGGEQYFVPLNMGLLDNTEEREDTAEPVAAGENNDAPQIGEGLTDEAGDETAPDMAAGFRHLFAQLLARCSRREFDRLERAKNNEARATFLGKHRGYVADLIAPALVATGLDADQAGAEAMAYATERVQRIADADGDAAVIDNDIDAEHLSCLKF